MEKRKKEEIMKEKSEILNKLSTIWAKWNTIKDLGIPIPQHYIVKPVKSVVKKDIKLKNLIARKEQELLKEVNKINKELDLEEIREIRINHQRLHNIIVKNTNRVERVESLYLNSTDDNIEIAGVEFSRTDLLNAEKKLKEEIRDIKEEIKAYEIEGKARVVSLLELL